jgi:outer membrane protein OmpA-like peptidoglycan-associated protein
VSRSGSRTAGVLVLLVAAGAPTFSAVADDAPVTSLDTRVVPLLAPVVDLELSTSDLRGDTRVDDQRQRIKVTLASEVLFGKDSARLRPVAASRLRDISDTLRDRGRGAVSIVGYTDDLGTAAHGLTLSRQRATAVARVLRRSLGEAAYPFTVTGKGEADPAVPNTSERNRKLNRRVVLTYRASDPADRR